ncbi:MAG: protease, partial [Acidobacteria bacterium]
MTRQARRLLFLVFCLFLTTFLTQSASSQEDVSQAPGGYFRFPAIHDDTIVFTAEGDLWQVDVQGGVAHRLTTHPAEESGPAISADGKRIAFAAAYEGTPEIYSMPISGGPPKRHTYDGGGAVVGWAPDGQILYSTRRYSSLPDTQLVSVDPATNVRTLVPLAQASDGCYDTLSKTLYFTRLPRQGSHTRRYQGGTAQNIWKYVPGTPEAVPLTSDCPTTSKTPMLWKKRVYFASDRDGTMNIWSMDENGRDVRQHTRHDNFEVQSPSLSNGRIVYQHGADIWLLDLGNSKYSQVPIRLASDFDH